MQDVLAIAPAAVPEVLMGNPKKAKRSNATVMYIRVRPEDHVQIALIAKERGYPHTMASVAAELISRGLQTEGTSNP